LDVSRIITGKLCLTMRAVELVAVIDAAIEAGFQIHVIKPVVPEELITVVASLVGRSGIESQSSGAWQN
jgi:CheY-like chemotaxis protein